MDPSGQFFARFAARLPRRPWQIAVLALLGLLSGMVVVIALAALMLTPTLPPLTDLADPQLKVPLRVYTADGQLIAEFGEEKRIPIKIEAVPERLIQAILAAEDHSFYQHHGVDLLGIVRAAWYNVRTGSSGQGASTITMQVARNFFLSPEKTYTRKFKEILLALKIERELTKQQILELYINKIFLGHRAYGFAAAARIYFGATLEKLTLPEMALLAGLPKAPSRDNPLTNVENATERRNYVLRHMQSLGFIDEATLTQALATPITASKHVLKFAVEAPYIAEMVRQYMLQAYDENTYAGGFHVYTTILSGHQRAANKALRQGIIEYDRRHGYRGAAEHIALSGGPETDRLDDALKDYRVVGDLLPAIVTRVKDKTASVYTQDGFITDIEWAGLSWARGYIDENNLRSAPTSAAEIVRPGDIIYIEAVEGAEVESNRTVWRLAQIPEVSGAIVSLHPTDGTLLALAGGFDFYQSSFNRAVQAERQAGSSLKPFIYTAALEKGFTAASTVSGAPIVIEDATLEDEWRPENYSKEFYGPTRLRKALALSLNLVAIRLLRAIGPSYVVEYMTNFGFDANRLPRNLSLALGTASVTPLQLTSAFAVYANGGFRIQPNFINRVEDSRGNVLEQANPATACQKCNAEIVSTMGKANNPTTIGQTNIPTPEKSRPLAPRAINPEVNFIMTSILQDVIRYGTAKAATVLGRQDLAGKTGTTDDYRDAWFVGFNSSVVTTTWIGFDQPASLGRGEAGGRAALPIWIDYMRTALAGLPNQSPTPPEGIVKIRINRETGQPTDISDPDGMDEYFTKDAETSTQIGVDGENGASLPEQPIENIRDKLF